MEGIRGIPLTSMFERRWQQGMTPGCAISLVAFLFFSAPTFAAAQDIDAALLRLRIDGLRTDTRLEAFGRLERGLLKKLDGSLKKLAKVEAFIAASAVEKKILKGFLKSRSQVAKYADRLGKLVQKGQIEESDARALLSAASEIITLFTTRVNGASEPGTGLVGKDGGTVQSIDGSLTLEVPPKAIKRDTEIRINEITRDGLPAEFDALDIGKVFELAPDGFAFKRAVTLRLRDSEFVSAPGTLSAPFDLAILVSGDEAELPPQRIVLGPDGPGIEATISHFSKLVVSKQGITVEVSGVPEVVQIGEFVPVTFTVTDSDDVDLSASVELSSFGSFDLTTPGDEDLGFLDANRADRLVKTFDYICRFPRSNVFRAKILFRDPVFGDDFVKRIFQSRLAIRKPSGEIAEPSELLRIELRKPVLCIRPDTDATATTGRDPLTIEFAATPEEIVAVKCFDVRLTETISANDPGGERLDDWYVNVTIGNPGILSDLTLVSSDGPLGAEKLRAPSDSNRNDFFLRVVPSEAQGTSNQLLRFCCQRPGSTRVFFEFVLDRYGDLRRPLGDVILAVDVTCLDSGVIPDTRVEQETPEGTQLGFPLPDVPADFPPESTRSCSPPPGSVFPPGTTLVTCKVRAPDGREVTTLFTITVKDTTAPVITQGNLTVEAADETGATVDFTPIVSDAADPAPALVCDPPSGSFFAIGTQTVNCTATDAAGNPSTHSFEVTVTPEGGGEDRRNSQLFSNGTDGVYQFASNGADPLRVLDPIDGLIDFYLAASGDRVFRGLVGAGKSYVVVSDLVGAANVGPILLSDIPQRGLTGLASSDSGLWAVISDLTTPSFSMTILSLNPDTLAFGDPLVETLEGVPSGIAVSERCSLLAVSGIVDGVGVPFVQFFDLSTGADRGRIPLTNLVSSVGPLDFVPGPGPTDGYCELMTTFSPGTSLSVLLLRFNPSDTNDFEITTTPITRSLDSFPTDIVPLSAEEAFLNLGVFAPTESGEIHRVTIGTGNERLFSGAGFSGIGRGVSLPADTVSAIRAK